MWIGMKGDNGEVRWEKRKKRKEKRRGGVGGIRWMDDGGVKLLLLGHGQWI